jgi:signal transduction histidine kinase
MHSEFIILLQVIISIVVTTAFIYLYFGSYRKALRENRFLNKELAEIDVQIERRVKERTKQLESMCDSISDIAVQRFELAQELELKNQSILEQKDLTEKQSEKLREAFDEIKRLESFRQQMVQMIIHDLKNPLNVILNLTDTDTIPARPKSIIRQISFEMLDLILNLLEAQKFKEMKMKVENENINLNSIVKSLTEKLSPLFFNTSIEFKTSVPPNCWIYADRHIVNRIITNILSNSIKFTPSGGKIQLVAKQIDKEILFEIKDNGNGIPENQINSVFDMYEQGVNNEFVHNSSTGIGLAYCRIAVEALGGMIGIKSEYGKGTKVWFTLCAGNSSANTYTEDISSESETKIPESGLTKEDIEYIKPYITDLKSLNICEVTEILNVIKKIVCTENLRIMRWKESLEETLFSANETRYRKLIDII